MNPRARRRIDYLRGFRDGYEGYPRPTGNDSAEDGWCSGHFHRVADVGRGLIVDEGTSPVPRVTGVQVLTTGTLELVHHGEDGIPPGRFG